MSECVVRMEMPKEGCHTCDARCVSALYGYICGIERKNVMPFIGKKNRPDWCPIICQLPEGHGRLVDADASFLGVIHPSEGWFANYNTTIADRIGKEDMRMVKVIVPADTEERMKTV